MPLNLTNITDTRKFVPLDKHQCILMVNLIFRLAANNEQFLTKVLGIKDPKHRSKITIKAMDVVLFGPPKG